MEYTVCLPKTENRKRRLCAANGSKWNMKKAVVYFLFAANRSKRKTQNAG
jgi:hypothetical protein